MTLQPIPLKHLLPLIEGEKLEVKVKLLEEWTETYARWKAAGPIPDHVVGQLTRPPVEAATTPQQPSLENIVSVLDKVVYVLDRLVCEPGCDATIHELTVAHVDRVLAKSRTMDEAAKKLGINPATLYRYKKRYLPRKKK